MVDSVERGIGTQNACYPSATGNIVLGVFPICVKRIWLNDGEELWFIIAWLWRFASLYHGEVWGAGGGRREDAISIRGTNRRLQNLSSPFLDSFKSFLCSSSRSFPTASRCQRVLCSLREPIPLSFPVSVTETSRFVT